MASTVFGDIYHSIKSPQKQQLRFLGILRKTYMKFLLKERLLRCFYKIIVTMLALNRKRNFLFSAYKIIVTIDKMRDDVLLLHICN